MLNLDRLDKLGKEEKVFEYRDAKNIEVLKNKNLIYSSMNLGHLVDGEWKWQCGFCKDFTLIPILDYRCEKCDSKVIKVGEIKHIFYNNYIKRYLSLGKKLEATANEDNQER